MGSNAFVRRVTNRHQCHMDKEIDQLAEIAISHPILIDVTMESNTNLSYVSG